MSSKLIPQKTVVTCDGCQQIIGGRVTWAMGSKLIYQGDALDYQGSACANAGWERDLCDDCWMKVHTALQATFANLKPAPQEASHE
jgi:hypothetical protein